MDGAPLSPAQEGLTVDELLSGSGSKIEGKAMLVTIEFPSPTSASQETFIECNGDNTRIFLLCTHRC